MQSQVLVPLDGSKEAEAILPHALFFAQQTQSHLTLLRVIMPPGEPVYPTPYIPDDWYAGEVNWTKSYLTTLASRLQAKGVHVQTRHMEATSAGTAIYSYVEQQADVRLIALATHGRSVGGRMFFGSVAENVFAAVPTSLLFLHPHKDPFLPAGPIVSASYQTVMVLLDGTSLSERVLERAATLAQTNNASMLLVAVPPPSFIEQEIFVHEMERPTQLVPEQEEMKQADFLAGQAIQLQSRSGLSVQTMASDAEPAAFIERYAVQHQQHLLIVSTREQAEHKVMSFLHRSNVPVLFLGS